MNDSLIEHTKSIIIDIIDEITDYFSTNEFNKRQLLDFIYPACSCPLRHISRLHKLPYLDPDSIETKDSFLMDYHDLKRIKDHYCILSIPDLILVSCFVKTYPSMIAYSYYNLITNNATRTMFKDAAIQMIFKGSSSDPSFMWSALSTFLHTNKLKLEQFIDKVPYNPPIFQISDPASSLLLWYLFQADPCLDQETKDTIFETLTLQDPDFWLFLMSILDFPKFCDYLQQIRFDLKNATYLSFPPKLYFSLKNKVPFISEAITLELFDKIIVQSHPQSKYFLRLAAQVLSSTPIYQSIATDLELSFKGKLKHISCIPESLSLHDYQESGNVLVHDSIYQLYTEKSPKLPKTDDLLWLHPYIGLVKLEIGTSIIKCLPIHAAILMKLQEVENCQYEQLKAYFKDIPPQHFKFFFNQLENSKIITQNESCVLLISDPETKVSLKLDLTFMLHDTSSQKDDNQLINLFTRPLSLKDVCKLLQSTHPDKSINPLEIRKKLLTLVDSGSLFLDSDGKFTKRA